ncbi:peptidylprolyl isomerase [Aurantiacibacter poecillastricola]|uniref:peptidylprolyl isomerase n=1 Tax=Aurantiacibacter poecillastricola TaxID=3064385 RepID=UPI00273DEECE|nr:peptidylprolyl isomerase [Aurantiacibacter sp. 219JJ12-13]MDP5262463.1 peptidylprolyl isomerase [Aurantiacibacter sp. 219JJ12-13]
MLEFATKFLKSSTALIAATAGVAMLATSAQGQGVQTLGSDAFNLPDDISFIVEPTDPNVRRATARVNGNIITGTDVDHRVALILSAQEGQIPEEEIQRLRLQVLRNLIDETLQVQEAAAQEMPVTAEEVDASYERFAQEARGMTVEEMDAYLTSIGSSPRSIKRQIQGELAWDRLLRRNITPFVNVSEGEVNELFERLQASRGTTEYRLGEIFLSATPVNREQVLANANQIVEQLRQGGSFVTYARQYSQASSAIVGGDLGWIRLEQLQQPTLEAAAQQMAPGQLVGPLEIPGGYSILLMIDQRQIGMADPRDAVLSLKQISIDFPGDISQAEAEQRGESFLEAVDSLNGCGDANLRAAAIGAATVDNELTARQLPEALQSALLQLNVGQSSPPFGELVPGGNLRVLMLCGRDDPQETQGPSTDQIMAQLEDERVNRRAQSYLRDLRRDAVIEYN